MGLRNMTGALVFEHPARIFRPDNEGSSGVQLPLLDYLRATVMAIARAATLRDDLSLASFRHGGFTEVADADLTDTQLRAAGRHRSARQLPTYAKRTPKQLIAVVQKRRAERTNTARLSQ